MRDHSTRHALWPGCQIAHRESQPLPHSVAEHSPKSHRPVARSLQLGLASGEVARVCQPRSAQPPEGDQQVVLEWRGPAQATSNIRHRQLEAEPGRRQHESQRQSALGLLSSHRYLGRQPLRLPYPQTGRVCRREVAVGAPLCIGGGHDEGVRYALHQAYSHSDLDLALRIPSASMGSSSSRE